MEREYILEYKVSNTHEAVITVTNNPYAELYRVLAWARAHQYDIYGVTIQIK